MKHTEKESIYENQEWEKFAVPKDIGALYFNDSKIKKIIRVIAKTLKESGRDSMILEDSEGSILFSMERDKGDFDSMSNKDNSTVKKIEEERINLFIRGPDLVKDTQWKFVLPNGKTTISAKIKDKAFLCAVLSSEIKTLYAQVKIPCILQTECEVDTDNKVVPRSKKYTILEVIGSPIEPIKKNSNLNLFDK